MSSFSFTELESGTWALQVSRDLRRNCEIMLSLLDLLPFFMLSVGRVVVAKLLGVV